MNLKSLLKSAEAKLKAVLGSRADLSPIAGVLEKLVPAPYRAVAKAVLPAALSTVAAVILAILNGSITGSALNTEIVGLVGSVIAYFVPNSSANTPVATVRVVNAAPPAPKPPSAPEPPKPAA